MRVSAYIPCYNNFGTVAYTIESILEQTVPIHELIVIDDGSTDSTCDIIKKYPVRLIRNEENKGRGFVRNLAMKECKSQLVLSCDATNCLAIDFLEIAIPIIQNNENICSISGSIRSKSITNTISRWRSRHLFKEYLEHTPNELSNSNLITYGTLVKKNILMSVGNFDKSLRHSEDEEIGLRLKSAKFQSLGHTDLKIFSIVQNTLPEVLERYWRWYAGKDEQFTLADYIHSIKASIKPMAKLDIKYKDFACIPISLLIPHYFLFKWLKSKVIK